jgi:hypothetical protein
MYDLNEEQDQKIGASGPIPSGSIVLVRLNVRKPKYHAEGMEMPVGEAESGMLFLSAEYEVVSGAYEGLKIWENLFLPRGLQKISMTEGQEKACNIAGGKLKGIMNAARGVMPKDDSPSARRKRMINSWMDFHELEFPVQVGIAKEQKEGKDGRLYWNNTIYRIVTPDVKQYRDVMDGGEYITDGPVTGNGNGGRAVGKGGDNGGRRDDPGYERPPDDAYESDLPF